MATLPARVSSNESSAPIGGAVIILPSDGPRFPDPSRLLHVSIVFFVVFLLLVAGAAVGGMF